jgi:hypothetical protein
LFAGRPVQDSDFDTSLFARRAGGARPEQTEREQTSERDHPAAHDITLVKNGPSRHVVGGEKEL